MTNSNIDKHKEIGIFMANLDKVVRLRKEDFEQRSFDEVRRVWEQNHVVLLTYIKSTEIPYFGLHGTNGENLRVILKSQQGHFNVATFYDKEQTERRLIQLYSMSNYVVPYTQKDGSPGGILVFNLELNGENITYPWEHLVPGSFHATLETDSENQKECFEVLVKRENTLWRADHRFKRDSQDSIFSFSQRYKGLVPISDEKIRECLEGVGMWDIPMSILRDRIRAQYVLSESMKLLAKPPS